MFNKGIIIGDYKITSMLGSKGIIGKMAVKTITLLSGFPQVPLLNIVKKKSMSWDILERSVPVLGQSKSWFRSMA